MLLNDAVRMERYREAIHRTVRPGDLVLDLGSGSGILALFACQAGAAHVYCVEREPIIRLARQLAEANGYADRLTFLQTDIRELVLDRKVDVIQSELIAKGAVGENMAELVGLCRDRFLKPGGRIVPQDVLLWVAPVECARTYARSTLPQREAYGLDFEPMLRHARNRMLSVRLASSTLLADGQVAYRYQAMTAPLVDVFDTKLTLLPTRTGVLHGFVAWFSATLAEGITLSNPPPGTGSWDNHFFPVTSPVPVDPETTIGLRLRARSDTKFGAIWQWDTTVEAAGRAGQTSHQSSFYGELWQFDSVPA